MSEYNRFVSYMYVYENNVKSANNGFVRVETRNGQCFVYIHMKDLCQRPENVHRVYYVRRYEGNLEGIFLGEMNRQGGQAEFYHQTGVDDIEGTGLKMTDMAGVVVISENGKKYGTCWDDELLDFRVFRVYEKCEAVLQTQSAVESAALSEPAEPECVSFGERMDKILDQGEKMNPFKDDTVDACVRFELQDIGLLPMRFWMYASNSFVLGSYYSHRHLILCRDKQGRYILGVPGMGQKKDKFMAQTFGFTHFMPVKNIEMGQNEFGYWYVELNE